VRAAHISMLQVRVASREQRAEARFAKLCPARKTTARRCRVLILAAS